jgi:hypothetical protein
METGAMPGHFPSRNGHSSKNRPVLKLLGTFDDLGSMLGGEPITTRPALWRRSCLPLAPLVLLATVASGCGSAQHARPAGTAGTAVSVSEKDFHISAPTKLRAGEVTFTVRNKGPERHEFIVAHVGVAAAPLRTDGLTVDEEAIQKQEVGELEPGEPGSVRTLRLTLAPGRYIFFCNMAGHYRGGMRHEVVVQ